MFLKKVLVFTFIGSKRSFLLKTLTSSYFSNDPVISWGFTSEPSNFIDASHEGCKYPIQAGHETCGPFPIGGGEDQTSAKYLYSTICKKKIKRFSWECDDGAESGSKCRKSCDRDLGWQFTLASWQTPRTEIQCICRGTCKWAGSTHVCKRSGCTKPPNFPFVSDPGKFSFPKLKNSKKIMNK